MRTFASPGAMTVDWEERVNPDRLRTYRFGRARAALEAEGITVRDAQQVMLDAREVKSIDEIMLLNTACSMVDGAYQMLAEKLKPGVRESDLVADVTRFLFELGSEHVDNINAVSG